MRPGFLVTGLVLWIAVAVVLFSMWSRGDSAEEGSAAGVSSGPRSGTGEPIIIRPGSDPDEDDDEAEDIVTPVKVTPTWSEDGIEEFLLTDSSGETLSKSDLLGTPWIASFIFTRCAGPCPRVTEAIKILQRRYEGQDVRFVTFTVDPKNDTADVLSKYAKFWEADPERWFFLTGDRDEIYRLINTSFLMPVMEDKNPKPGFEIIHTTNVCLVDPTGRVVGKYNSLSEEEVVVLRRDLDVMLEQPSAVTGEPVVDEPSVVSPQETDTAEESES